MGNYVNLLLLICNYYKFYCDYMLGIYTILLFEQSKCVNFDGR